MIGIVSIVVVTWITISVTQIFMWDIAIVCDGFDDKKTMWKWFWLCNVPVLPGVVLCYDKIKELE